MSDEDTPVVIDEESTITINAEDAIDDCAHAFHPDLNLDEEDPMPGLVSCDDEDDIIEDE